MARHVPFRDLPPRLCSNPLLILPKVPSPTVVLKETDVRLFTKLPSRLKAIAPADTRSVNLLSQVLTAA